MKEAVVSDKWRVARTTNETKEQSVTIIPSRKSVLILVILVTVLLAALVLQAPSAFAQTGVAAVSGEVTDQQNKVIPDVEVEVKNVDTGVSRTTKTNGDGLYSVPGLIPGHYLMNVRKEQFQTVSVTDIVLNVQDNLSRNFVLQVGSSAESITVNGSGLNINTTDASVSTVVDRTFVENVPLNGRSFQGLILLSPGVVNVSPQNEFGSGATAGFTGEFSVNGQRDDANYYMVDGVSANVGTYHFGYGTDSTSGSLPNATALGTTQNLVPLDALQEFRIQSSTYSAEYGRTPGGQFSFLTRSGTNDWHGSAFDYIRNTIFDANNWFNDYLGKPKSGERQNDFGGAIGGPVVIPGLYNGKDKTFFFFSFEGVRLGQPVPASIGYVPDLALRQSVPAALQPVFNAWPIPNGPDLGNGMAEFIGFGTAPSSINSPSVRIDHVLSPRVRLFFRFANTNSQSIQFGASFGYQTSVFYNTRSYTFGATSTLSNNVINEFRFNYTHNDGGNTVTPGSYAGGAPVNLAAASEIDPKTNPTYENYIGLFFGSYSSTIYQAHYINPQTQSNLTDSFTFLHGHHQIKAGIDYRRITPDILGSGNPAVIEEYFSEASVLANTSGETLLFANQPVYPVYINNSVFVQDDWKVTSRLSLSMGLRWEVNPAPGNRNHTAPYVIRNADNPSVASVAPYGTPVYDTYWYNFAPRFGAAYVLRNLPGRETVIRGGFGVFFDTGQESTGYLYGEGAAGYGGEVVTAGTKYPVLPPIYNIPVVNPPTAPYSEYTFQSFEPHQQLPYSLEWNAAVEQALGRSQSLTISYLGSRGDRLTLSTEKNVASVNPEFATIEYRNNQLSSDYDALQLKFQRNLGRGLQALASYTYSHCIDYSSTDYLAIAVSERGSCDFDLRHSFSSAFSYNLPRAFQNKFAAAMLDDWGTDGHFTARTGFPLELQGSFFTDPSTGQELYGMVNTVPGVPQYLYGSQYPGGREINPEAFALPAANQIGDYPRNSLRGFGAWQMDLAIRREFPIYEKLKLQFRAEGFNVFNHPNFGAINTMYGQTTFGRPVSTLNVSLGALSPIYQSGGPRSMQFSLKLLF